MTLAQALTEYGEVVVINGNPKNLDAVGYIYPLTATTMAFEIREKPW